MKRGTSLSFFVVSLVFALPANAETPKSPLSAADSLRHFQLAPGLQIELVAAEPQVVDPIEIRFDARGRLWVVEMRDYPNAVPDGEEPLSRIRVLEDRNGDGTFEDARTFADDLRFVTGLQPWRGGLFVTLSGQLVYMKDNDGDGKADQREVWYRGFKEENSQLRANHPRLGLDNRIYVTGGLRGGKIVDTRRPGSEAVSIDGRDFAFDPLTGDYEAVSGLGQFGLTFDDYGNRFFCSNREPTVHVVLEDHYVRRNPFFAPPAVVQEIAKSGADSRVFPVSRAWTTSVLHAHQFTAACGLLIYRDDALGRGFRGNSFVCEPTGNLVHRGVLTPSGVSFSSRPAREGVEFLASADAWFRPVNLTIGPRGGLYVVDMYRAIIEHPKWLPPEEQDRPDFRHGEDRGRIYRVTRVSARPTETPRVRINLKGKTSQELVALLEHDRAWWRETAARLLLERQAPGVQTALQRMTRKSAHVSARVQALWSLSGLQRLDDATLLAALADTHSRVREQAVRLAEPRLSLTAALKQSVMKLADDRDPRVRFQVALSLGGLTDGDITPVLAGLALKDRANLWTRRALGTLVPSQVSPVLLLTLASTRESVSADPDGLRQLVRQLAAVVGAGQKDAELSAVLRALVDSTGDPADDSTWVAIRRAGLIGLSEGTERRGVSLLALLERMGTDGIELKRAVHEVFVRSAKTAAEDGLPEGTRVQAMDVLRYAPTEVVLDTLIKLATGESHESLRLRAIDVLSAHRDLRIGAALLLEFASQTPETRRRILDVLLASTEGARLLLDELAAGRMQPSEVDPARTQRLLEHSDEEIRSASQRLLGAARPDREKVIESYRAALALTGDAESGKPIFVKRCATCHKIGDIGVDVGPQIEDSREKTREQLFFDVLDPNRAIDARYLNYLAVTRSGEAYTGIVTTETSTSVTLRQPEAKMVTILRQELLEFRTTGRSLMPEGLEQDLSQQDLADLLTYVKEWRYLESGP